MAKPSIFSRDYDRRMKKRRRTGIISLVVIALVVLIFLKTNIVERLNKSFAFNNNVSNEQDIKEVDVGSQEQSSQKDTVSNDSESADKDLEQQKSTNEKDNSEDTAQTGKNNIEEKMITLLNNQEVIILVKTDAEIKTIEGIKNTEIQHSINPEKQLITILDKNTNSLFLVDIEGNVKDITNPQYVSSSRKVYKKEDRLKANPDYIWVTQPVFLNDNTILYLSNLPWFNKNGRLYLWVYSLDTGKHFYQDKYNGMSITYGNITENGLEMNIDGKVKYYK